MLGVGRWLFRLVVAVWLMEKGGVECDWLVGVGDHVGGIYAVQRRVVLVNRGQDKS